MTIGRARRAGLIAIALAAVGLPATPASAADPAVEALRAAGVYASPRVLGEVASAAEAEMTAAAAELDGRGTPVKLAVVVGPAGAPSLRVYARRLRSALDFDGTVVVTAPRRRTVAVGARAPAAITRDLRRGRVREIANPVDRVITAARLAVGPRPDPGGGDALRGLLALLGLGLIGGTWAAAWGLRRERRTQEAALSGARARARVQLDALAARADALGAQPHLSLAARRARDRAVRAARAVNAELDAARREEDVERALPELRTGLREAARAAALSGDPVGDDPFAGLCRVDPAHGPATGRGRVAGLGPDEALCARCAALAAGGEPPSRRMVPVGGHPVPFDEADLGDPGG